MRILKLLAIIAISLSLSLSAADNPAKAGFMANLKAVKAAVPALTPKDLMEWNKTDKKFILVDVRKESEVAMGTIDADNALQITRGYLEFSGILKNQLPIDKTIVIYCAKGARGALAAKVLIDNGYKNVYNLTGGVYAWLDAGYPIVSAYGTLKKAPDSETGLEQ